MYYSTQKKLLIVGGANFSADLFEEVYDNGTPVIAADGGVNFLSERNISPELVMGDLDSASEQKIQNIEPEKIIRIPDQDSTDLESFIQHAISFNNWNWFLGSRLITNWLH